MTRPLRPLLVMVSILACILGAATPVQAHSGIQSYVYVSISDSSVDGRVEYPVGDLGAAIGIDFSDSATGIEEVVVANADSIRAYTADHLAMEDADGEWELSFTDDPTVLAGEGYAVVPFTVDRSFDAAPRDFRIHFDGIIHDNPERDALLLIENDWGTAQFDNEAEHLLGFSVGTTSQLVQLDDVGTLGSMGAARGLGTNEVRTGIDHLLFVVALLLPVALVTRGGSVRGPAPTLNNAIRRAAGLLGVFIAANSVMLWVVGANAVDWPSDRLVGALVAGSLLVMAAYAVWQFTQRELLVVGGLGAIQGIGFAHAFVDGPLDGVDTPLALLAFNIGVEVGVVTVAVLVFPLLLLLRRTALAALTLYGVAGAISAYAGAWLIERVAGADFDIERFANPMRVWPRNLWLMLLAWAFAGALAAWAAHRGTMRPLDEGHDSTTSDDHARVLT